jgi:hypothetical protein
MRHLPIAVILERQSDLVVDYIILTKTEMAQMDDVVLRKRQLLDGALNSHKGQNILNYDSIQFKIT